MQSAERVRHQLQPSATPNHEGAAVQVAQLDTAGVIAAINSEWRDFGGVFSDGLRASGVGTAYLAVCDAADPDPTAGEVASYLRASLLGGVFVPLRVRSERLKPAGAAHFDVLISSRFDDWARPAGATVVVLSVDQPMDDQPWSGPAGPAARVDSPAGERDRIAGDLHDHIVQEIFATGMTLSSVLDLISEPRARERVSRCVDDLDAVIRHLRDTIYRLDSRNAGSSLRVRLLEVLDQQQAALAFTASHDIDPAVDELITDALADDVLAVVREALSKIARHAQASAANVRLSVSEQAVIIEVIDNGRGVGKSSRSSGLANLRRRARTRSGELTVSARAGGGTRLRWTARL